MHAANLLHLVNQTRSFLKGEIFNSPPAVSREKSLGEQTHNILETSALDALVWFKLEKITKDGFWAQFVDCLLLHRHFCQLCHFEKGVTNLKEFI